MVLITGTKTKKQDPSASLPFEIETVLFHSRLNDDV